MSGRPAVSVCATTDKITIGMSGIEKCVRTTVGLKIDLGSIKGSGVELGVGEVSAVKTCSHQKVR